MNENKVFYGRQNINDKDIQAVVNTLKSDFLTQGPKVREFEIKLAKYCNSKFCLTTNSATTSLYVALNSIQSKKEKKLFGL